MKDWTEYQWRHRDFLLVGGERSAHLEAISPLSQGGLGRGSPLPIVTKFKIIKCTKVLEKESIFKRVNILLARKIYFFLKIFEKLSIFTQISEGSQKITFKISI